MEVKAVAITPHAIITLNKEFEYLKENASLAFAFKFREKFVEVVSGLDMAYLLSPECRLLATKNKIYRNAIWRDYLFVYKILKDKILVLGAFHARQNPVKLKPYRRIKE
jgi:hypothetical protein